MHGIPLGSSLLAGGPEVEGLFGEGSELCLVFMEVVAGNIACVGLAIMVSESGLT